jgi:hypothetical protein
LADIDHPRVAARGVEPRDADDLGEAIVDGCIEWRGAKGELAGEFIELEAGEDVLRGER